MQTDAEHDALVGLDGGVKRDGHLVVIARKLFYYEREVKASRALRLGHHSADREALLCKASPRPIM